MKLKNIKIIGCFGVFITCFISHFVYDIFPCLFTSILFPVNESIWEHMKLLFTSFFLYSFIELFLLKKFKLLYHNFLLSTLFSSIIIIPTYLILYLPIFKAFGEYLFISLILLFISIVLTEFSSYFILSTNTIKFNPCLFFVTTFCLYFVFGILTFYPIKNYMFLDILDNSYGCDLYLVK